MATVSGTWCVNLSMAVTKVFLKRRPTQLFAGPCNNVFWFAGPPHSCEKGTRIPPNVAIFRHRPHPYSAIFGHIRPYSDIFERSAHAFLCGKMPPGHPYSLHAPLLIILIIKDALQKRTRTMQSRILPAVWLLELPQFLRNLSSHPSVIFGVGLDSWCLNGHSQWNMMCEFVQKVQHKIRT